MDQAGAGPAETQVKVGLRATEVLEVAVLLEKTATDFYRLLSDQVEDGALRNFFLGLTGMELGHERKMRDLLATLSDPSPAKLAFDDGLTGREYFLSLRDLTIKRIFPEGFELFSMIDNFKDPADALPTALALEEKSVRLYRVLARFQLAPEAAMVVEHMIREEEQHLAQVNKLCSRFAPLK